MGSKLLGQKPNATREGSKRKIHDEHGGNVDARTKVHGKERSPSGDLPIFLVAISVVFRGFLPAQF